MHNNHNERPKRGQHKQAEENNLYDKEHGIFFLKIHSRHVLQGGHLSIFISLYGKIGFQTVPIVHDTGIF